MRGQQDRFAAAGEGEDQVLDLATAERVEPGRRLVEDDEVGVVDERLSEADAARHALGKFADDAAPRVLESDHVEQLLDALPALGRRG